MCRSKRTPTNTIERDLGRMTAMSVRYESVMNPDVEWNTTEEEEMEEEEEEDEEEVEIKPHKSLVIDFTKSAASNMWPSKVDDVGPVSAPRRKESAVRGSDERSQSVVLRSDETSASALRGSAEVEGEEMSKEASDSEIMTVVGGEDASKVIFMNAQGRSTTTTKAKTFAFPSKHAIDASSHVQASAAREPHTPRVSAVREAVEMQKSRDACRDINGVKRLIGEKWNVSVCTNCSCVEGKQCKYSQILSQ